jgi:hypothetical protein
MENGSCVIMSTVEWHEGLLDTRASRDTVRCSCESSRSDYPTAAMLGLQPCVGRDVSSMKQIRPRGPLRFAPRTSRLNQITPSAILGLN